MASTRNTLLLCCYTIALLLFTTVTDSFTISSSPKPTTATTTTTSSINKQFSSRSTTKTKTKATGPLYFFDKVFEESGPLGKGITVGKVQVALSSTDRSLTQLLERLAKQSSGSSSPASLSRLANEVCLNLLRRSDSWIGACSDSSWFKGDDAGKAESTFNDWANREAAKFEKEYIPGPDSDVKGGGATDMVVSLIVEIQGDETNFEGAGFSYSGTQDVLNSIASDCLVDGGYCLNAAEVFWTPGDRDEVLTKTDVIIDFPELVDL